MDDTPYFVIANDRQQLGPASEVDLDGWLYWGRISMTSLTWRDGDSAWIPLRERLEFLRVGETRHIGPEQEAVLKGLATWLENHHYVIGTPVEDVSHTKMKIAATVAVGALKFAAHLAGARVHNIPSVSGKGASADVIARAVTPLQGLTDLLAVRYDAWRGDRLAVGLIGDALTSVGFVRRMEICHEVATALLPFGFKSNGQSGFATLPILFYFDSARYEAHRRLIAQTGYRRSWLAGGWSFIHATICDVRRRVVESPPPKGFFSGMQKSLGLRPFSQQDLLEVLALAGT